MFEGLVNNIKRKFSRTAAENKDNIEKSDKSGVKRGIQLFRIKPLKTDGINPPANYPPDTVLSPRAIDSADSAITEIEWPILIDNNPNILDKFTRIVTITDNNAQYDKRVGFFNHKVKAKSRPIFVVI